MNPRITLHAKSLFGLMSLGSHKNPPKYCKSQIQSMAQYISIDGHHPPHPVMLRDVMLMIVRTHNILVGICCLASRSSLVLWTFSAPDLCRKIMFAHNFSMYPMH